MRGTGSREAECGHRGGRGPGEAVLQRTRPWLTRGRGAGSKALSLAGWRLCPPPPEGLLASLAWAGQSLSAP